MRPILGVVAALAIPIGVALPAAQAPRSPQQAVDALLEADRAFSAASLKTTLMPGLSAMFGDEVVGPVPGGQLAKGKAALVKALATNANGASAVVEWAPVRGGISADGTHGFTFGYMTEHQQGQADVPLKYLSYWVRQPAGWRVAAYKRARRGAGAAPAAMLAPALPARLVSPVLTLSVISAFRDSLVMAERAFSDEAQRVGLEKAFATYGSADAANMGGPGEAAFVIGAAAIGRAVSAGDPPGGSPASWSADQALVASSGDLGVTMGMIRVNAPTGTGPREFPFFTIWRRPSMDAPWRYVAE